MSGTIIPATTEDGVPFATSSFFQSFAITPQRTINLLDAITQAEAAAVTAEEAAVNSAASAASAATSALAATSAASGAVASVNAASTSALSAILSAADSTTSTINSSAASASTSATTATSAAASASASASAAATSATNAASSASSAATSASNASTSASAALASANSAATSAAAIGSPGALVVSSTGSVTGRSLASRFSETLNLLDFIQPGDTDATAGIGRAVARALALGAPITIRFPAGSYTISSSIQITTAGAQGIYLCGDGSGTTVITQAADADGFVASLTNYGGRFSQGAFAITGMTLKMAATSSTRTALSVSTTAVSGTVGAPMVVDDINLVSPSTTARWGVGIRLVQIPNIAYLRRINSVYSDTVAGVAMVIAGTSTSYTTNIHLSDSTFISGNIGLSLGDYLQGIHVNNLNTINSLYSVKALPSAGVNEEINIGRSYLDGKIVFAPSGSASLNSVKLSGSYIDSSSLADGETHVSFTNVPQLSISDTLFNGRVAVSAGTVGLSLSFPLGGQYETSLIGTTFQAYGNGGTALKLDATTQNTLSVGSVFINNTTDVSDLGTGNTFIATSLSGTVQLYGAVPGQIPISVSRTTGLVTMAKGAAIKGGTATIETGGQSTGVGGVSLVAGDSTHPGWVAFNNQSGTRIGYIGYGGAVANFLDMQTGSGFLGYRVTGQLQVAGAIQVNSGTIDGTVIGGTTPAAVTGTTVRTGGTPGPTWTSGTGAPSSTQPLGSMYSRTDGSVGTTLYVSRGGGTWNPVAGV